MPENRVTYVGAVKEGSPEGTAPPRETAFDDASIIKYDLLEGWYEDPDVTTNSVLDEKAEDRLRPEPTSTLEFNVVAYGTSTPEVNVPRFWHDFDLGDTVYVSVRDENLELYDVPVAVTGVRLEISEVDDAVHLDLLTQDLRENE